MSGLRYGLRNVLTPDHPENYAIEISEAVRHLLTAALAQSPSLAWQTFTAGIYLEAGDTGPLVIDIEIDETDS